MKETQLKIKDKVVIEKQAQQEKQLRKIGTINPHKGHTLYEVNLNTGEVFKAKFEECVADFYGRKRPKQVLVNEGCIYVAALNIKSLMKKLIKAGYINAK